MDETESISNSSFGQIIQDCFREEKGVIIGRVQTRDRVQFKKCYYHYFYAVNLVKILFKSSLIFSGDQLMSRYHDQHPLIVKNPLTNEIIVGEVEFYLIKKD